MVTLIARGGEYDNKFKPGEKQYMYVFAKEDGSEYVHFADEYEQEKLQSYQDDDQIRVVRVEGVNKNTGKRYTSLHWPSREGIDDGIESDTSAVEKPLTGPQEKRETRSRQRDRCIAYQSVLKAVAGPLINDGKSADDVANAVHFLVDDCFAYSSSDTTPTH